MMRPMTVLILIAALGGCSEAPPPPEPALPIVHLPPSEANPPPRLADRGPADDAWHEVDCEPYRVRVSMPGDPQVIQSEDQLHGQMIRSTTYVVRDRQGVEYTTVCAKLPAREGVDPQHILDGVQRGLVGSPNGKLADEQDVSFEQHPGRQLTILHARGTMWVRIYLIDGTLVQLIAISQTKDVNGHDVDRFLNSLKLAAQGS